MCRGVRSLGDLRCIKWSELAAIHEEIEEPRMGFEAAVLDLLYQLLQLLALGLGQERHACAFDGRIADLDDFRVGKVWNQSDAAGGIDFQMTTESTGQIEDVD